MVAETVWGGLFQRDERGVNASSRYKAHGGEIARPGLGVGEKEKGDRAGRDCGFVQFG